MKIIIVDMSEQPAGEMFGAGTDWYYRVEDARVDEALEAFKTLGMPARLENS